MNHRFPSLLSLAAIAAALGTFSCSKDPEAAATTTAPAAGGIPVTLEAVRAVELQRSVRITGTLAGLETATISNRVAGLVTRISCDRGDRVKPGQVLLEIEPDRFKMAVDESQAALQQTLARLGIGEIPGDDFDVNQTAPVKKAQSDYDNAKEKFERYVKLKDTKAITDLEFSDIEAAFKSAASSLENSRDEARALLAMAHQNRSTIDMRRKDFTDSQILAPDGATPDGPKIDSYAIVDRKASPGEYLREGTALFTIVADGMLRLQSQVPERYLSDVKKNATVTFHVEAYPKEAFEGRVTIVDPAVDQRSRTFQIEAMVDNSHYGNRLRPGSFVPGDVLTKKDANCMMVPLTAITRYVGVTKLYKVDTLVNPPVARAIAVTTGQEEVLKDATGHDEHWVEVSESDQPLKAGDRVATSGLTKLTDGSAVADRTGDVAGTTPSQTKGVN